MWQELALTKSTPDGVSGNAICMPVMLTLKLFDGSLRLIIKMPRDANFIAIIV